MDRSRQWSEREGGVGVLDRMLRSMGAGRKEGERGRMGPGSGE